MKKRILVPYVAATLAMAASISVAARDGAVVARSYMNYNDQKPSVATEYRYQTVGISWTNTYKIVTAEEARQIQDGIVSSMPLLSQFDYRGNGCCSSGKHHSILLPN